MPPEDLDTKTRILDAAETLFADHGFAATSLRAVTRSAGVNLAAVNYHFGSKDALIRAVFERLVGPINRERLDMLDAVETAAGDAQPRVEDVVRAFLAPPLRAGVGDGVSRLRRVMARGLFEPGSPPVLPTHELFAEIIVRFRGAMHRALPGLDPSELGWGFRCMVGALVQTLMLDGEPRGAMYDAERHLVHFVTAGLRGLSDGGGDRP